jgi:hypothetical protein
MAPFHSHNVFKETTNTQNVIVSIGLKQYVDNDIGSWALFGKRYCIDNDNSILHKRHWFMTVQNQRTIPTKEHTVHLDFFNPINLIYFWGFQKSKVKAVTLLLNDRIYFEGPLQALEFLKISSGFGHLEPVVMFFSQNRFNERPHGSINFSRINNVKLCIDTDQLDFKIHVVGLNMQKISFDKDSYSVDFVMKNALISRLPQ